MDYLCSACYSENPIIEEVMQTPWLDGVVADQVALAITPFPLPYHVHSYPVAELVPYFMDLCIESSGAQCYSKQYKDFSFQMQSTVLGMKDTSLNDFKTYWADQVATELGLDSTTILDAYSSSKYNVDSNTRTMLKYAWSKGVFGTPTVFINGVMLDSAPFSVDGWIELLNEIYESQFQSSAHSFLQ